MQIKALDQEAMQQFGGQLAALLQPSNIVYLRGPLGAGKTTLVRGMLHALGYSGAVKSPTYTLVEPYQFESLSCYHFDLYRLTDPEELEAMGIRDYLSDSSFCLIEWPEKGIGCLPAPDWDIEINYHPSVADKRDVVLNTRHNRVEQLLEQQRF